MINHRNSSSPLGRSSGLVRGLLLLGLAASAAQAASFSGRVRDKDSNSYLLGASVTLRELNRTEVSDSSGQFTFGDIPAGSYSVAVSFLGYKDLTQSITVSDQVKAALDLPMQSDVVSLGAFVVEGTREGQLRALQQKRSAENVMDIVSADAVGKFPDGNAAEALRRVPGISLQVDQDEGRYVVLRGLDSSLNTVTLNNQLVGTPSEAGNRGIAMDSVPADLISRLEVTKAVTPDMDGNAVGGSINIVTVSAFDRAEPFLNGSVGGFYDSFSQKLRPNGSVVAGTVLGADKQWGVVLGASYSLKDVNSQTANTRSWSFVNGFWLPLTQQNYDYDVKRERLGGNFALQFRPAAGHELALRIAHNEFSDDEARQSVLYEYRLGTLSNQTALTGANSQGRASRQFRDYHQTGTINAYSLEGKHQLPSDFELSWQAGTSEGKRDTPVRVDWEYRSATGAFPNTYYLGGQELVITPTTGAYYDPANYPFRRVRFRSDFEVENVYSGQADLKHKLQLGDNSGSWKVGAKYVKRKKNDDRNNKNYNLAAGQNFTLAEPGLATPEASNYFRGLFRYGPGLNVANNNAYFFANPGKFTLDPIASLSDSLTGDFNGSEEVTAGYLMGNLNFGKQWSALAGVRYEHTDAKYSAYQLNTVGSTFSGSYTRFNGSKDYDNFMPGVHLNWRPNNRLVLRAAWTNTISRPNYSDLAPRRSFDAIETAVGSNQYTGSLSTGNPNLKPYESMNLDLSAEYYLNNGGILSLGGFHKEIDNPIYSNSTFQTNVTVDGRFYTTLSTTSPANAKDGKISGLELNYQQFFKFLPSPFDGLGFNLNYTMVDSEVSVFGRADKLPFFRQSDRIANFALFFEKYGLEARVAFSYSGDYLDAVGTSTDTDIYVRGRGPIDAKVSYRINRHFKVFGEFLNITEEPLREYTGIRARENDFEIYDWKARFGVNFNY